MFYGHKVVRDRREVRCKCCLDIITYVEDCKKLIKQYTQMTPLQLFKE